MRLAIRGLVGKTCIFEERVDVNVGHVGEVLPEVAERHARRLASHELQMIEIEFLDEPNLNERFFRFGTDPSGMVIPVAIAPADTPSPARSR